MAGPNGLNILASLELTLLRDGGGGPWEVLEVEEAALLQKIEGESTFLSEQGVPRI